MHHFFPTMSRKEGSGGCLGEGTGVPDEKGQDAGVGRGPWRGHSLSKGLAGKWCLLGQVRGGLPTALLRRRKAWPRSLQSG